MADADAVKALERAGWDERAGSYDLLTGRITARFVEPLLDAAGARAGIRLLDVGSGPGHAAARARQRGTIVTGVDIAGQVVTLARTRHRGIRFVRADAEALPFAEHSFDAVVAGFAVSHFPRPERALREFARVLAPGGRVALSTWDSPERNRYLGIFVDALEEAGVSCPRSPPQGAEELRSLLRGGGFEAVEVRSLGLTERVADADELWRGLLGGSVRTAGLVMRQPAATRERVRAAVERLAAEHRAGGGLAIPVRATLAGGRRP